MRLLQFVDTITVIINSQLARFVVLFLLCHWIYFLLFSLPLLCCSSFCSVFGMSFRWLTICAMLFVPVFFFSRPFHHHLTNFFAYLACVLWIFSSMAPCRCTKDRWTRFGKSNRDLEPSSFSAQRTVSCYYYYYWNWNRDRKILPFCEDVRCEIQVIDRKHHHPHILQINGNDICSQMNYSSQWAHSRGAKRKRISTASNVE